MQSIETLKQLAVFDRERIEHVLVQHNRLRSVAQLGDLAEAFSEHAVLEILGDRGMLPYAGRYEGRLAIVDALQRLAMEVKFLSSEIADLLVDHDRAMMRVSALMRHRGTGLVLQQEIWDLFTFESGLIVHQIKHFDIQTFRRLCAGR